MSLTRPVTSGSKLTGRSCPPGRYWDTLVRHCTSCELRCQDSETPSSCSSFCVSARCKATSAHYYDRLLKKCVNCADICGRHPAECSPHCNISRHISDSTRTSVPTTLEDSTIVLYFLLSLSVVLLLSSLVLALVVFLKGGRNRTSKPRAKEGVVQTGPEHHHPGRNSKQFTEDPDDTNPTETCACIHCFPDLKGPGQNHSWLQRDLFSFCNEDVLQRAPVQTQSPTRTQEGAYTSVLEVQQEVTG